MSALPGVSGWWTFGHEGTLRVDGRLIGFVTTPELAKVLFAAVEFTQASMARADLQKVVEAGSRLDDPELDGQVAEWMALGEAARLALDAYRAACEQVAR